MNKICNLVIISSVILSGLAYGKEVACIPRSEMGETKTGEHLYERDADLKISNLSRIDFDQLTITSAEGNRSEIVRVEKNAYKTASPGAPYYFTTNHQDIAVQIERVARESNNSFKLKPLRGSA